MWLESAKAVCVHGNQRPAKAVQEALTNGLLRTSDQHASALCKEKGTELTLSE